MDIFLRAKHLQIFTLVTGLPIVLSGIFAIWMVSHLIQSAQPDPLEIFGYLKYFLPFVIVLGVGGKLCWQYSVAIRLQSLAPPGTVFKNTAFKIFFWFIILYYPLFFTFIFSFLGSSVGSIGKPDGMPDPSMFIGFIAIFPLAFFNTFCMFYSYYYTAKTYKTVELQRPVNFSDFILECVLIWFFFIGVWMLQPKINKMIDPDLAPGEIV